MGNSSAQPAAAKTVLSWSGGKDSALALERLRENPDVTVVALLTTVSTAFDRVSIHGVRRTLLHRQAQRVGIPVAEVALPASATNETYETAFAEAVTRLRAEHPGLGVMAFGDLFLDDVRAYRDALLARHGWSGVYPLWGEDTTALAADFAARGYRAVLTCVDTTQLDARFAGREFDAQLLRDLPDHVDPCGERGEFHTFVYDGPGFAAPVHICLGERVRRDERFEYCDVLECAPA